MWRAGWRGDFLAILGSLIAGFMALLWAFAAPPHWDWQGMGRASSNAIADRIAASQGFAIRGERPVRSPARQALLLRNFNAYEDDPTSTPFPTKHWSRAASQIVVDGLGRGWWQATLALNGYRPDSNAVAVTLGAGAMQTRVQLRNDARQYVLLTHTSSGDWTLPLRTTTFVPQATNPNTSDTRDLGVILHDVALSPVSRGSLPPQSTLLSLAIVLLSSYAAVRFAGWRPAVALLVALSLGGSAVIGLRVERVGWGLFLPRLAGASVAAVLAVLAARWAWHGMARLGRFTAPRWVLPALLGVLLLGYYVKVSGTLFPYARTIDVPWHMKHTSDVLNGHFWDLYRPGPFSRSVMPQAEWGDNPPLIPYSPFYYFLTTPYALLPWPMEWTANVVAVLMDVSRGLLLGALVLRWGLSGRAAVLAAALYAITPFTFLLHSWGNLPTTFGMWWVMLTITALALGYDRLRERKVFALVTALLLASLLFYTVMGVFMGVFVVVLLVALRIWGREYRPLIKPLSGALGLAVALSILIYYGQYLALFPTQTWPYIQETIIGGKQDAGQDVVMPFSRYWRDFANLTGYWGDTLRYGVWLPFLLGIPGLALLRRQRMAVLLAGVWLAVAVIFFVVGLRVSMVDKHTFFLAPVMALTAAALLDWAWRRWRWFGVVLVPVYGLTLWFALNLWVLRLTLVSL